MVSSLRTAEQPRIDVKLEVGNVAESIQVTGTPPLLETETATSGQVLEGQTIVKMPVLQKAFYRIYLYMPGMNRQSTASTPSGSGSALSDSRSTASTRKNPSWEIRITSIR